MVLGVTNKTILLYMIASSCHGSPELPEQVNQGFWNSKGSFVINAGKPMGHVVLCL